MITYTEELQDPFNKAMFDIQSNEYYCILLDEYGLLHYFKNAWQYIDYLKVVEGFFIYIASSDTSKIKYVKGEMSSSFHQLLNINYERDIRL